MPDEKPYKYETRAIPTYEEATTSRTSTPFSSRTHEHGDEDERQGLIGNDPGVRIPVPTRRAGYRPPTVEHEGTDRTSLDDVDYLDAHDELQDEDQEVRREMEEMEMLDPPRELSLWGKRISSISQSLHLPFNIKPFDWRPRLPKWDSNLFILMGRIFAIFLVVAIVYILFISGIFTNAANRMRGQIFDPESVRIFVQEQVDASNIKEYLRHLTLYDHIAGTEGDYVLAQYVEGIFAEAGLEQVWMDEYEVYLNYPVAGGRAVEILGPDDQVQWAAKIEEEEAFPGEDRQQAMVFHGHSKSGDVRGPLIYANYGSREDFQRLHDSGIVTQGAIALVRYYGTQGDRALKVKAAEQYGFVGCIIYSDPAEDGFTKGEVWPNGRYRPADGVQRGSVALMSWVAGDVLSPGWPSKKGQLRLQPSESKGLNKIPSIPLSWRDAQPLLQAIKGHGVACVDEWKGAVPDIEWWTGNFSSPHVHLKNEQDEVMEQPIWNVMGRINGIEQSEKSIIIGNHRDAWTFGAVDPGSGTAVMLEVVRIFGYLVKRGWRPLRTIEFASWDGEEYNLVGSTEFVEDNMRRLRKDGIAYINVDVAVSGQELHSSASPVFKSALLRALDRTVDPSTNQTMRKVWDDRRGQLEELGAGSDFVAFQDMAGMSSMDLSFHGPPFPYHSVYDNFDWMDKFGDPGFTHHQVLGQIWALLLLDMADRPILPFDMEAYSSSMTKYVMDLQNWAEGQGAKHDGSTWSIEPLRTAVLKLQEDVQEFVKWEEEWMASVYSNNGYEVDDLGSKRLEYNNRMSDFETNLLDLENNGGLKGRDQYKHILFAPTLWSGYDSTVFPAVRDAIDDGDWTLAQMNVEKAARLISVASDKLLGKA